MTQISNTMTDPLYDAVMAADGARVPPLANEETTRRPKLHAKP